MLPVSCVLAALFDWVTPMIRVDDSHLCYGCVDVWGVDVIQVSCVLADWVTPMIRVDDSHLRYGCVDVWGVDVIQDSIGNVALGINPEDGIY
jgi:hypothetical protein